jgi:hypothetical protein
VPAPAIEACRGQALAEAVLLWAVIGLTLVGAGAAIARSDLPTVLAGAIARPDGAPPAPTARTRMALERSLRTGRPSPLAVGALLVADVGAARARAILTAALAAEAVADPTARGVLDVTDQLDRTAGQGLRLGARAIGPFVLVGLTTPAMEAARAGRGALPDALAADAAGDALDAGGQGGDTAAALLGERLPRLAGGAVRAIGVAGTVLGVATLLGGGRVTGPAPGDRAGDAVLCRPVDIRWYARGVPRPSATARGREYVVLRGGRVIARRAPLAAGTCGR